MSSILDRAEAIRRGGAPSREAPESTPHALREVWKPCTARGQGLVHRWAPMRNNCARYRCEVCDVVGYRYDARAGIGAGGVLAVTEEVTPYLCDTCHGPATHFVPHGGQRQYCPKCRPRKD